MQQANNQTDWTRRMVEWFMGNVQLVTLLLIAIIVSGLFSLATLRREGFPSPDINVAIISTVYRGASPTEVERQIIKPIEAAIQGVKGVNEVNSNAANSFGLVSVSFDSGIDFNAALSDLRGKVQNVTLPNDAEKPNLSVPDIGGNNSFYALVKKSDAITDAQLVQAGEELRRSVEAVSDVKEFSLIKAPTYKVGIKWNPVALQKVGLALPQVQQALTTNNLTIPAGNITLNGYTASVVTEANFNSVDDVKNLLVGTNLQGKPVLLSEVAEVTSFTDNLLTTTSAGFRQDGSLVSHQAELYKLSYKPTADLIKADAKIEEAIATAKKTEALKNVEVVNASNAAKGVQDQVNEVVSGAIGAPIGTGPFANLGYILGGIWLITLIMLFFVNWRAAFISAIAIPLAVLITLFLLKIQGVSLNTLTLFSMVLVLGLVVDPAIVVIEAIQRQLDAGHKGKEAVLNAVGGVGAGVFMATITNFIVFLPFGVVSGIFGQIIRYIPITVVPAIIASYFVPLIFLTYLGQRLLKPSKKAMASEEDSANIWPVAKRVIKLNRFILTKKWLQVLIIAIAAIAPLGLTGALFATGKVVPVQFSAPSDSDVLTAAVEYPSNLAMGQKQALVAAIEPILKEEKQVTGYFPLDQMDGSVSFTVNLKERKNRDETSSVIIDRLLVKLKALDKPQDKVFYSIKAVSVGTPEQEYPVAINIYGDNLETLKKAAVATGDLLRDSAKFPNITRVEDGFTGDRNTQIEVVVNRAELQARGLSAVQVAQAVAGMLGEVPVGKFDRTIDGIERNSEIVLLGPVTPTKVEDIANMPVGAGASGVILLKDVASVSQQPAFGGIQRLNGSRYITVKAKVKDAQKDAAFPQSEVKSFWNKDRLAQYGLRSDALEDKGSGNEFIKSFQDLFLALGIAVVLTYIVLVVFFRSFSQPLIILFTIPLGFLGVFPALVLVGGQFGFLEILGLIVLVGIVENVAIFLIDHANRNRKRGQDYRDAIAEATGVRFRPIFLTSVVSVLGLLPLILFSPFWRSLAAVVSSGILVSGLLSIFTTPILYSWFLEFKGWLSRSSQRVRAGRRRSNKN